jgi:prepilin-type N-terminal cleavage/methylation domain-containing protein
MQNFLKNIKESKEGFTLVETLVSITIFSVAILGLLSILASSITDTTYAKQEMIAGYLAQEGIEYVRNARDNYVLYNYDPNNPDRALTDFVTNKIAMCNSGPQACGFNSSVMPISFVLCGSDSTQCKLHFNNGVYNDTSSGVDSGFSRRIWFTVNNAYGSDDINIYSEVDWKQGSTQKSITFSEDLFNWVQH